MRKIYYFYLIIYYKYINILMKYYQRHIKIIPTANKNLPLTKLLFNYTGDEYEPVNFKGFYNGLTPTECIETFSNSLYKCIDKYIQNDNFIVIGNFDEYKKKLKNICNATLVSNKLYIHQNNNMKICDLEEPNPYDLSYNIHTNKYHVKTEYNNMKKLEIFIGLYKFNNCDNKYEYVRNSFYDKENQIFYLYIDASN